MKGKQTNGSFICSGFPLRLASLITQSNVWKLSVVTLGVFTTMLVSIYVEISISPCGNIHDSMSVCLWWSPNPCGVKSIWEWFIKKSYLSFLHILTLLHHCILGSWKWMAFILLDLVSIVLLEAEKTGVWSRPKAWVFKVGWFWASEAHCTMTTSLHEWNHGGCVTQRARCVPWHTPPQFLGEKNRTHLLMVICNISLRWNSYSSQFWC